MRILIIDLEKTARTIGTANIKLNSGIYLVVRYYPGKNLFAYKWGQHNLTREGASLLLEQHSDITGKG